MKIIHRINLFLSQSIALLNAGLAVFLVLVATGASIQAVGWLGIFPGLLLGVALAVMVCGLLAVLINIRDLLAASLDQRPSLADPRSTKE